ncbi:farnesyl pyrophosphate synthase isoform X3 [Pristis pectinata]|uniref:farnesyl pyrophosphate synthase isoform X3 n=1 Tax=Pristis pectinata TaxID=685728 RepID=UPI00223CE188|nr:farnesyl pyrophosphate synthase isoform X3 [Pristis pectinata]
MFRQLVRAVTLAPRLGRCAVRRELAQSRGPPTMNADKKPQANSDGEDFDRIFAQVVDDLTQEDLRHPEIGDAIKRLRELQAFFLVADDIMDQSVTRRGQVCWYRKDGVGLDAINDSYLLEAAVYRLLRRYLRSQPCYVNLLELFLQTSYQTELGQSLDLMTAQPSRVDLDQFTEERYKAIVKYKTAFYSFYLPVAAAMYMPPEEIKVLVSFLGRGIYVIRPGQAVGDVHSQELEDLNGKAV